MTTIIVIIPIKILIQSNIVYVGGNTYEPQQQYIYTGGGTTTIIKDQDTVYEGGRASFDHDIMGNNYLNSLSWNGRNVYYNNDGIKNTNIKERKLLI